MAAGAPDPDPHRPRFAGQGVAGARAMGLTVSDAVRMLLTRVANEGALPAGLAVDPETHDAWVRAKVREALDDPRPDIPNEEVEARFAARRAETRCRLATGKS